MAMEIYDSPGINNILSYCAAKGGYDPSDPYGVYKKYDNSCLSYSSEEYDHLCDKVEHYKDKYEYVKEKNRRLKEKK